MFCLIYVSSAVNLYSHDELLELIQTSVKNNLVRNITGFLIYTDGVFMQALEGREEDVEFIFDKILNDERHHQITVLSRKAIERRGFEKWSMGFKSVRHNELMLIDGYSAIANLKTMTNESLALKALLHFAESNRVL